VRAPAQSRSERRARAAHAPRALRPSRRGADVCGAARSALLALHRTAVLRHDEVGQETLLNLLLRNYLHYNLYDQARPRPVGQCARARPPRAK